MKRALVLAGGLPQVELINQLKIRGYYTILVDYSESPMAEAVADKFYRESTLDIPKVTEIAEKEAIDMIMTCCTDQALATVAVVASRLNLPCYIDEQTGWDVTDKEYMKDIFFKHGIPTAKFIIVDDPTANIDLDFPLVVKPVDCNSSKGVAKVGDSESLKNAISEAIAYSREKKAVVEEYVEGREISVDAFCIDGEVTVLSTSYSEKIGDSKGFVIWKGIYPAITDEKKLEDISNISKKIVEAFKLKNCPLLIQMIDSKNGIKVIEFSARTGGCLKYRMIEHASGVDVIESTIDLFEKKKPILVTNKNDGIVSDEFIYCSSGIFDHIENENLCLENGWASEIYVLKNKGEKVGRVKSSGDRVAAIVIKASSYEEYVEKHNKIAENIKVRDVDGNDIMRHDCFPNLAYDEGA